MKPWKTAALAAALAVAAAAGAAYAPAVHAQTPRAVAPRAVQIFAGGSHIGVSIKDVEENDAKTAKLTQPGGVLIEEVEEDSPASRAGLKKGDVVVEFDGERVRSARQFTRLVQETPAGRKATTSVIRDGQRLNVTIEPRESNALGRLEDLDTARVLRDFGRDFRFDVPTPPARPARPVPPAPPVPPSVPDFETFVWRTGNTLGMTVGDLSQQLAGYFGVKDGVLVTSVADDSAAAKAGIKAGDIVTSFNGDAVSQPSDLRRRVQRLQDGDEFTVGVVRDKKSLTLKGKAETTRSRRTSRTML
jgi:S1-C subfamily serine protease